MGRTSTAITALLVLGGCIGTSYKPQEGETWRRLRAIDFPARAEAVVFPDGTSMDDDSHAAVEKWRIRFQNEDAPAQFLGCNDQACPTIAVGELTCRYLEKTAAANDQPCDMIVSYDRVAKASKCFVRDTDGETLVAMGCPSEIRFLPKQKRTGW